MHVCMYSFWLSVILLSILQDFCQRTGRLIVSNDLDLYEFHQGDLAAGFSSGGFLGNLQ